MTEIHTTAEQVLSVLVAADSLLIVFLLKARHQWVHGHLCTRCDQDAKDAAGKRAAEHALYIRKLHTTFHEDYPQIKIGDINACAHCSKGIGLE